MTASLPKLLEERRELIACPRCRGRLDLAQQVFLCTSCGEAYAVEQGLPRLFWFHEDAGADDVTEDELSLTISTRKPAAVLSALSDRGALAGLQVRTATLEDVFLDLTGREYRA